jgi:hypothetical protein
VAAAAARILVDFESSPHGGHWRPLPDSGREPAIAMRTVIHHSIVGSAEGAFQYFAGATAIESTFIVKKSGYFWQCISLGEQADANFRANAFAGSIETEDNGHPDTDPWTAAHIDTLVWLSREMRRLRPRIALRKCRTWDDAGLGYHTLFPSQWTNVPGKTCPGAIRKRQWASRVLPRYLSGAIEEGDDDMTSEQARRLRAVYQALIVPGDDLAGADSELDVRADPDDRGGHQGAGDDQRRGGGQPALRPGAADREPGRAAGRVDGVSGR